MLVYSNVGIELLLCVCFSIQVFHLLVIVNLCYCCFDYFIIIYLILFYFCSYYYYYYYIFFKLYLFIIYSCFYYYVVIIYIIVSWILIYVIGSLAFLYRTCRSAGSPVLVSLAFLFGHAGPPGLRSMVALPFYSDMQVRRVSGPW